VIFVECQADQVIIYPSRRRVPLEALSHTPNYNVLFKTIEQMVARRLSTLLPGETPPHVQVRFLVHRDAERTLHLAYPGLAAMPVEKVQYILRPGEDVERLIRAY
jgi:hypothetical protein